MPVPTIRHCQGMKRNRDEHSRRHAPDRDDLPVLPQIDAAAVGDSIAAVMQSAFEASCLDSASAEVAD